MKSGLMLTEAFQSPYIHLNFCSLSGSLHCTWKLKKKKDWALLPSVYRPQL